MSVDAVVEDKPKGESTVKAASKGRGRGGKGEARGTTPTTAKKPEKRGSVALDGVAVVPMCKAYLSAQRQVAKEDLKAWLESSLSEASL